MDVWILGNKCIIKYTLCIAILVLLSAITILYLNVDRDKNGNKTKGGDGYGMFDKATKIEILYDDKEYVVSGSEELATIICLCRKSWGPANTNITKEDCDMIIKFIGTDTDIWVNTETLSSYIGKSFVQMPEDLFQEIRNIINR